MKTVKRQLNRAITAVLVLIDRINVEKEVFSLAPWPESVLLQGDTRLQRMGSHLSSITPCCQESINNVIIWELLSSLITCCLINSRHLSSALKMNRLTWSLILKTIFYLFKWDKTTHIFCFRVSDELSKLVVGALMRLQLLFQYNHSRSIL